MTKARVPCLTLILQKNLKLRNELLTGSAHQQKNVIKLPHWSESNGLQRCVEHKK